MGVPKSWTWLSNFFTFTASSITMWKWKGKSIVSESLWPHELHSPWNSPGQGIPMEWVTFPFSRGSSQPRDQIQVSHIAGGFFTSWATTEAHQLLNKISKYWRASSHGSCPSVILTICTSSPTLFAPKYFLFKKESEKILIESSWVSFCLEYIKVFV